MSNYLFFVLFTFIGLWLTCTHAEEDKVIKAFENFGDNLLQELDQFGSFPEKDSNDFKIQRKLEPVLFSRRRRSFPNNLDEEEQQEDGFSEPLDGNIIDTKNSFHQREQPKPLETNALISEQMVNKPSGIDKMANPQNEPVQKSHQFQAIVKPSINSQPPFINGESNLVGQEQALAQSNINGLQQPAQVKNNINGLQQPAQAQNNINGLQQPAQAQNNINGLQQPAQAQNNINGLQQPAQAQNDNNGLQQPAQAQNDNNGLQQPAQAQNNINGLQQPAQAQNDNNGLQQSAKAQHIINGLQQPAQAQNDNNGLQQPAQVQNNVNGLLQPAQVQNNINGLQQPAQAQNNINGLQQPAQAQNNINGLQQPAQAQNNINGLQQSAKAQHIINGLQQPAQAQNNINVLQQPAQTQNNINGLQQPAQAQNNINELPSQNQYIANKQNKPKSSATVQNNSRGKNLPTNSSLSQHQQPVQSNSVDISEQNSFNPPLGTPNMKSNNGLDPVSTKDQSQILQNSLNPQGQKIYNGGQISNVQQNNRIDNGDLPIDQQKLVLINGNDHDVDKVIADKHFLSTNKSDSESNFYNKINNNLSPAQISNKERNQNSAVAQPKMYPMSQSTRSGTVSTTLFNDVSSSKAPFLMSSTLKNVQKEPDNSQEIGKQDDGWYYNQDIDDSLHQGVTESEKHAGKQMLMSAHHFDIPLGALAGAKVFNNDLWQKNRKQYLVNKKSETFEPMSMALFYSWIALATLTVLGILTIFRHRHKVTGYVYDLRWHNGGYMEEGRRLLHNAYA